MPAPEAGIAEEDFDTHAGAGWRRRRPKHGPLANLDMPPITMVFQVKDPVLEQVKAGHKVKF